MASSSKPNNRCSSMNEASVSEKNKGLCSITLPSPKHMDPANSPSYRRRYLEWAAKQKDPVPTALGVTIRIGGADDTPSSPVTIRRSQIIRKAAVSLRCSGAAPSCVKDDSKGVKSSPAIGRNRKRTTIRFEEREVIWTRTVDDPRKFCGNVLQIPVDVIKKCFRRRISRIMLWDPEKRTPYYCEVRKTAKKNQKYCIGGWYEFGRDRRLEVGDEVHFRVRYERLDKIVVSVVRRVVSGH